MKKDLESPEDHRDDVRGHIMTTARRLFAESGVAGVTTRQIIGAAGHRNATAINYYFGSKDGLVAELIGDVVTRLEKDRHARLDLLEANGGARTMRDVLEILATPLPPEAGDDQDGGGVCHIARFFNMVLVNHRDLLLKAMGSETDSGTRRCLALLRRMMPPLPRPLVRERLYFVVLFLMTALSSREAASENPLPWQYLWDSASATSAMLDAAEAMLVQPPSERTLSQTA